VLAAVELHEAAIALVSLVVTVVTGVIGGVRWLGRHFDKLGSQHAASEIRSHTTIDTLSKKFIESVDRRDASFTKALADQEALCVRERERDRTQHAHEIKLIFRLAGLPDPGDTSKFKAGEDRAASKETAS